MILKGFGRMLDAVHGETPLAQFLSEEFGQLVVSEVGVQLFERQLLAHVILRGDPEDQHFLSATEKTLDVRLPLTPNTVAENGDFATLWMGPNEWLILGPPHSETKIISDLREILRDQFSAVNDLSGGQTIINLQGSNVRDVLSKGCTLDLHPRVFGPKRCVQTRLGKTNVMIRQMDNSPSFDIIVRRSFSDYLARWINYAAQEYGIVVVSQPIG